MRLRYDNEAWRIYTSLALAWVCGYCAHHLPLAALGVLLMGLAIIWVE